MTLKDRLGYCRRRMVDPATLPEDLAAWLAEHDGLLVAMGLMRELNCRDEYVSDERLKQWFQRGLEDGRVLQGLEDNQKILVDTHETPC